MEYCDVLGCAEYKPCHVHGKPCIVFALNGEVVSLDSVDPQMTLAEYVRTQTSYQGTKLGCLEGGCGACTVVLERMDPQTKARVTLSANSCLRPLAACDGWAITTTEGLGGSRKGYHPIQERMANLNGVQCGFCTPGMVMAMYGTLNSPEAANGLTMEDMENSLDGNICRCTGYRPILDVAKSFAKDSNVIDNVCKTGIKPLDLKLPELPDVIKQFTIGPARFARDGVQWIRPASLHELLSVLTNAHKYGHKVRMVVGGTGFAFDKAFYHCLVDLQGIPELLECSVHKDGLRIGAATTLNNVRRLLREQKDASSGLTGLDKVLGRVANNHVRNVGSLAGNIMLAKTLGFVSDVAPALVALQARVVVRNAAGTTEHKMREFLSTPNLAPGEVVQSIFIPHLSPTQRFRAYKLAPGRLMAHADVNGSFFADVQGNVLQSVTCVFGGFKEAHAASAAAEAFLHSKSLDANTVRGAVDAVANVKPVGKKTWKISSASTLIYKFLVSLLPDQPVNFAETSRALSTSSQSFSFPNIHAPVSEPIQEVSAKLKAAGEARFTDDIPITAKTTFGYFVLAPAAAGLVGNIEVTDALKMPGVLHFIGSEKISGTNNIGTLGDPISDPLFVAKGAEIGFYGQPVGLIIADSLAHARRGAQAVRVHVDKKLEPVLSFEKAKESKCLVSNEYKLGDAEAALVAHTGGRKFGGKLVCNSQQHFAMEPQTAYAIPEEDGKLTVHCAMQWPIMVQNGISQVLGVKSSDVNIIHRRAGGGFGGKLIHPIRFAAAAALAAKVTGRPVRITADRSVDGQLAGGREEMTCTYAAACNDDGVVTAIKLSTDTNAGNTLGLGWFANFVVSSQSNGCYNWKNYLHKSDLYRSNMVGRTAMRAPGDLQACYIAETIIDHVSQLLSIPPEVVRERNMYPFNPASPEELKLPNGKLIGHWTMPRLWPQMKNKVRWEERLAQVATFNQTNRWRKQGVAIVPIRYEVKVWQRQAVVNIYADGGVLITQDGCEIGQGLYTKVLQAGAYHLGTLLGPGSVPMDLLRMGDTATYTVPNGFFTGGSTTSEGACQAVRQCCDELINRMRPSLEKLIADKTKAGTEPKVTWVELCGAAAGSGVHLSVTSRFGSEDITYQNMGCCFSHVELDSLSGELQVLEANLLYDCGKSLNPAIDIGQCEGAFVMGLGYYFTEKVHLTKEGRLKSNNTWNYKLPLASDIPVNFSVEFLQDSGFDKGILSSKASGEPPLTLATSTMMACKQALYACRAQNGLTGFLELPAPATRADLLRLCGTQTSHLTL